MENARFSPRPVANAGHPGGAMVRCFIGLGSNMGDRARTLSRAVELLWLHPQVFVRAISPVYETVAAGNPDQPPFLNAAVTVETALPPADLLHVCKRIEAALGRPPDTHWQPRWIDLDILLYGEEAVEEPDLRIPHPELRNRPFALIPLLDLDADCRTPEGERLADALRRHEPVTGVIRIPGSITLRGQWRDEESGETANAMVNDKRGPEC